MCLTIKKYQSAFIAKEDIVCYKIVDKHRLKYSTIYQSAIVEIGKTYNSPITKTPDYFTNNTYIERALHSLKKLEDAISEGDLYMKACEDVLKVVIIQCIIPKGSTVYEGIFYSPKCKSYESYASNCIKYVKLVKRTI